MNLKSILHSRKHSLVIISIFALLITYILIKYFISFNDPVVWFFSHIEGFYLISINKFTNLILSWSGSSLSIYNDYISINGISLEGFTPQIMFKGATFFYIVILWLTRASIKRKIFFSIIYFIIQFLATASHNIAEAYAFAGISNYFLTSSIIYHIAFFLRNAVLLTWYLFHKNVWSVDGTKISGNPILANISEFIIKKFFRIIILLYVYHLIVFINGYFEFYLWRGFIINSSQKILELFGYDAITDSKYLIGNNGSVSLERGCLGIKLMFLFASLVYLTSNKKHRGWGFIMIGLIILNVINIIRVLLLFIHVNMYGVYNLAIDHHTLYNYIVYFIVFILWLVWFEKYLDIRKKKSNVTKNTTSK